jgi:hypothetical protein
VEDLSYTYLVSSYPSPSVGWVLYPCSGSGVHVQNPLIWVCIDCFNLICKFLLWPPLPAADAVGGVLQLLESFSVLLWYPGRPSFAICSVQPCLI